MDINRDKNISDEDLGVNKIGNSVKKVNVAKVLMMEDEVARLQRQYRSMESKRKQYNQIQRRKKESPLLRQLRRERKEILKDLAVADSDSNRLKDSDNIVKLQHLLDDHNEYTDSVECHKKYLTELDGQIIQVTKNMMKLKAEYRSSDINYQERMVLGQSNIRKLENRLELCTNRFCYVQAENRKLRTEIQHLINDRTIFSKCWTKFCDQLALNKKYMHDLMEQASISYSEREKYYQMLSALREKALRDVVVDTEDMQQEIRALSRQQKLENFLLTKSQRRKADFVLKKQLFKLEKGKIESERKQTEYHNILEDIKDYAQESSIVRTCNAILKREEINFSYFKKNNDLFLEMEQLSTSIEYCHNKIKLDFIENQKSFQMMYQSIQFRKQDEERAISFSRTSRQTRNLQFLKATLDTVTNSMEKQEDTLKASSAKLKYLFHEIAKFFILLKCDSSAMTSCLGQRIIVESDPKHEIESITKSAASEITFNKNSVDSPISYEQDRGQMTIYNVMSYLTELETNVQNCIKYALWVQNQEKTKEKSIVEVKHDGSRLKVGEIATPCSLCAENQMVTHTTDKVSLVLSKRRVTEIIGDLKQVRMFAAISHTVSQCKIPGARQAMKRRYAESI